jgi:anthranilate phosphoribosyltransferase
MQEVLQSAVAKLLRCDDLTSDTARDCVGVIMDGACDGVDIAAFLTAMSAKGPVVSEVVGAAQAMRDRCTVIATTRTPLLDTCGTGGDCLHTFNISTATAIVAAACGVCVAKHGNRSVSSSSGSADVLEALGVNISLSAQAAGRCLDETGIAFCFAPVVHGAMKHAAPVRRQLGFPTIFNLLGPLTNPAGAEYQLLGANSVERAELLAAALAQLGTRKAFVVCGNGELDEVCLWGPTTVFAVESDSVNRTEWQPEDFGLDRCDVGSLTVSSAAESAGMIRDLLNGERSAARAIVLANVAAALLVHDHVRSLPEGVAAAAKALDTGAAGNTLERLAAWSNSADT